MRVFLVEDSGLFRQVLAEALRIHGVDVVDQYQDAQQIVADVASLRPDAVILDIRLPPTFTDEGIRAAAALRRASPDLPILILSALSDPSLLERLLDIGTSGVGYLLKDRVEDVDGLVTALRRLADGDTVVDPTVIRSLVGRARPASPLTLREKEILRLVAEGYSNQGIAARIALSQKTVEKHILGIFEKLGLPREVDRNRRVLAVLEYVRER
ncbi:response regulator [Paractinoplanes rishiriensis]|uniref:DNA-binding response regulator n=1 Tax=Paractinoplanes rishiriensis TaxID=1050105 RepID=A0A919JXZ1_9ACTN|nr:response regulator transcription factor [Actinoplanes rishiriensis]GIE95560.1 DNA-binding response regulator [Actinoplanes rishiriensis]